LTNRGGQKNFGGKGGDGRETLEERDPSGKKGGSIPPPYIISIRRRGLPTPTNRIGGEGQFEKEYVTFNRRKPGVKCEDVTVWGGTCFMGK